MRRKIGEMLVISIISYLWKHILLNINYVNSAIYFIEDLEN